MTDSEATIFVIIALTIVLAIVCGVELYVRKKTSPPEEPTTKVGPAGSTTDDKSEKPKQKLTRAERNRRKRKK
ncbi:hypothetical protein [Robiginitalea biformata]|uniref:Uncharacterized protein n=1 Tax=Robiginitalea biformata (strain ATCC BAA-864 / DSM 15991 / KCTC 12146 / HTCC2501) TaxID=313596 RepID=A4CKM2_ROBBH|nr:hypothetical protein [Robiginitalea biformata]EAR15421.1 hypothetical protein RB2501_13874 [Robiginitalea biformata HTCC2501]